MLDVCCIYYSCLYSRIVVMCYEASYGRCGRCVATATPEHSQQALREEIPLGQVRLVAMLVFCQQRNRVIC